MYFLFFLIAICLGSLSLSCFLSRTDLRVYLSELREWFSLKKGQGYRGPEGPNDTIVLCLRIKYKTTLYILIYHLTHSRPTE